MKEIFDIKRFGRYMTADLKGCMAKYGLSALILSLSGVFVYFISVIVNLMAGNGWDASGEALRWACLVGAGIALIISMPVKCYGDITDKRSGSAYIMLPASTFEKFLSMILNCLIIIPAAFIIVWVGSDWLICTLDKTAGTAIIESSAVRFMFGAEIPEELSDNLHPLTAIDDLFSSILVFLLGGLCFKRSKAAKTILVLMGAGMAVSILLTPILVHYMSGSIEQLAELDADTIVSRINGLAWIDTTADLLVLCALLTGIFFRLKTIKH